MGIHIDDMTALASGFHRRLSELSVDEIDDVALLLHIETTDAPEDDLYDWLRQRIFDELQRVGTTP